MKHIKLFESFSKNYGEKISHEDFKNLKVGKKVLYMGTQYKVLKNDEFTLDLKPLKDGSNIKVNYSMFMDKGAINESASEMSREDLMKELKTKYKIKFVDTTENFNGSQGGIWLSAEDRDELPNGLDIFNYYSESPKYDLGVHVDFVKFLDSCGWYAEWNDPGTIMLWPN
jgi:hypothetical protein